MHAIGVILIAVITTISSNVHDVHDAMNITDLDYNLHNSFILYIIQHSSIKTFIVGKFTSMKRNKRALSVRKHF